MWEKKNLTPLYAASWDDAASCDNAAREAHMASGGGAPESHYEPENIPEEIPTGAKISNFLLTFLFHFMSDSTYSILKCYGIIYLKKRLEEGAN